MIPRVVVVIAPNSEAQSLRVHLFMSVCSKTHRIVGKVGILS